MGVPLPIKLKKNGVRLIMAESQQTACCSICQATSSPIWRRNEDDTVVCLECHSNKKAEKNAAGNSDSSGSGGTSQVPKKKKNNRRNKIERAGRSSNSPLVNTVNKITYKGRRSLAKDIVILFTPLAINMFVIVRIIYIITASEVPSP